MPLQISRREFLKIAAFGTAISSGSILAQRSYLPDFIHDHALARQIVATTCGGCSAGCGILVEKQAGKIIHVLSNPNHPRQPGFNCPGITSGVDQFYSKRRLAGALYRPSHARKQLMKMGWEGAEKVLREVFRNYDPNEIAFLLGGYPDHLSDLIETFCSLLGGGNILRFNFEEESRGNIVLQDASQRLFGMRVVPFFDTQNAQVIFSFGADYSESWLPDTFNSEATLVHFGERLPENAPKIDCFFPLPPAHAWRFLQVFTHFLVAQSGEFQEDMGSDQEIESVCGICGFTIEDFKKMAALFLQANTRLAIPAASFLSNQDGLAIAQAVLALNVLADSDGSRKSIFLPAPLPFPHSGMPQGSTVAQVGALLERVRRRQIKVIFVHHVDLLSDLPAAYGVAEAYEMADRIISFSPMEDATSEMADFLFPDHVALESWGYQNVLAGSDRPARTAFQPVVPPRLDTRATTDLLLRVMRSLGYSLNFGGEESFILNRVMPWMQQGGVSAGFNKESFWKSWLKEGGWWKSQRTLMPVVPQESALRILRMKTSSTQMEESIEELQLAFFTHDKSNKDDRKSDLLAVINIQTAREMGLCSGQQVLLKTESSNLIGRLLTSSNVIPGVVGLHWEALRELIARKQSVSGTLACNGERVALFPLD